MPPSVIVQLSLEIRPALAAAAVPPPVYVEPPKCGDMPLKGLRASQAIRMESYRAVGIVVPLMKLVRSPVELRPVISKVSTPVMSMVEQL